MSWFKKDGDQLVFRETGLPARLFIVENFGFAHYPNGEMLKFIDAVVNNGGNGIRVFGFFPFGKGKEEEPYPRVGNRFDLNRLNDAYVTYLRQWVGHAQKRGVAVLYELFDSVGLKFPSVADFHPFGQLTHGNLNDFSDLSNGTLVAHQENYLTQLVNILKEYPNVIFGIMNEFVGDKHWHYRMSRRVKDLAPDHLTAGTADGSTAMDDSSVDIWCSHCGSYDREHCRSNLAHDIAAIRPHIGGKILGYSTDGFQLVGMKCENPEAMRELAQDAKNHGLPIFRFLDHYAYVGFDDAGTEYSVGAWYSQANVYETSRADRANTATYRAIAEAYPVTPLPASDPGTFKVSDPTKKVITGSVLGVFDVSKLESNHPNVFPDKGGKAILATDTKGYLCFGPYVTGYPPKFLDAYFSIYIDDNKADNNHIVTLDVYDSFRNKVLKKEKIRRRQFRKKEEFNLFKLRFRMLGEANLEFRIYYEGSAYVAADKIAIVDAEKVKLKDHNDMLNLRVDYSETIIDTGGDNGQSKKHADPNIIISESLKDNKTQGHRDHGAWTSEGLQFTGIHGFLGYKIPTTPRGYIEFKARGFVQDELHGGEEYKSVLLTMWDGDTYSYGSTSYLFEFRKYGFIPGGHPLNNAVWFKVKAGGTGDNAWEEKIEQGLSWDPNKTYQFRVEWDGREGRGFRDSQLVASITAKADFAPPDHRIQIGATPFQGGRTAPANLLISDVVIGKL